jgi:hypothetical protein
MRKQIGIALAIAIVTCGLYAAVAVASSSSKAAASPASANVVTKNVTVTMTDYNFKLSYAGPYKRGVKYVFKTVNKGPSLHNFRHPEGEGRQGHRAEGIHLLGHLQEGRQVPVHLRRPAPRRNRHGREAHSQVVHFRRFREFGDDGG